MGNADGGQFYSSDYFYKAKDNQYLYMGPIWDFDISSGNVYYNSIFNPTVPWMQKNAKWYVQWFKDPGFKVDVVKQWNQLKADGIFTTWLGSINAQAAALELSQANNFGRWPMLGVKVWPNPQVAGSYDGEVAYLTNWLRTRIAYLDAQLNGKTVSTTTLTLPGGTLRAGMPVALTSKTIASGTPSGTVTFLSNGLVVGTATISGGTASGSYNLPAGTDSLTAVYNGDTTFGLSASSAQSVTVLAPLVESATNLSTSVSQSDSGASVSFAISVLATSGTTVPSGNVAINVNGNAFGNVSLTGGSATFVTTSLPLGANTIQAIYGGDTYFAGSTSPTLTVAVSRPTCSSPTSAGVAACSPTNNSTVTSPVRVQAASTVTGKLARMEVWVDGVKKYSETTSNILNTSLTLAAGKHRFDFCAVNTTGTKWETTVSSTVSSGLIAPTITWPNPASITSGTPLSATQLDATANVAGTFAYNPAAGTVLAVGTQTLSTTFTPTDTTHYGTATKSVSITVTGGTGCNAPTAAGVAVCSPINNSTAASPVKTQAAATITGTLSRMEVWVDGVKKYSETTSKLLNTSLTLAAGKHRFDFYAVNTSGAKWETSVYSTIQ